MWCNKCSHYDKIDEETGTCLRYPPSLIECEDGSGDRTVMSVIPVTFHDSRCGEFKNNIWGDIDETKIQ